MSSVWRVTEHGEHSSINFDARLATGTPTRVAARAPNLPPSPPNVPGSPARSAQPRLTKASLIVLLVP